MNPLANQTHNSRTMRWFIGWAAVLVVSSGPATSSEPKIPAFKASSAAENSGKLAAANSPSKSKGVSASAAFQFRPERGMPSSIKSGIEPAAFNRAITVPGCRTCAPQRSPIRGDGFRFSCEPDCVVGSCGPNSCGPGEPDLSYPCSPERDEFVCNGEDMNRNVKVYQDWFVRGLDPEDAIAHYDTVDGRTEHTVSNRVCLYAPRFGVVRKLQGLESQVMQEKAVGVDQPTPPVVKEIRNPVASIKQPLRPQARLSIRDALIIRDREPGLTVINENHLAIARDAFLPYEDLLLIQRGIIEESEKARLAERISAALVWMELQSVQVTIDGRMPHEIRDETGAGILVVYDRQGRPRLRLCKVASTGEARSGEIVEFTLRFDNLGDQEIGNVTILDSLNPRLEYVEGSASCSLESTFSTEPNEAESTILKWEITSPLKPLEGGLVRFKARVR
jgi:uncharacterized repeat protein (TIGR01451 family)